MLVAPRAGQVVYPLGRTFLRAGSDSVVARGVRLVRGLDYVLDPLRGELRLLRPPESLDTLRVFACGLVASPPLEVARDRYRPPSAAPPETARAAAPLPVRPGLVRGASTGASLSVTGNKTLAIDFGSQQDAFLRQSLDLAVSGSLAPGVELTGVLTDRNTPLTAEGSTQSLQSLDRVLIELSAPQGSAALGDVTLEWKDGDFGRIERRLQGARGQWTAGGFTAAAAAASAQGEYRRVQFNGVDGRQGPYALTDASGRTGVAVVAGSEIVTLDGQRLKRGENADYAMDYDRGELTFTNRRTISSASRITVEYQFALNRYRRNLAAAGGAWGAGPVRAFTRVIAESDDRGRPLDVTFDASDRAILAAAGDSATLALGAGVVAGGGDYDTVRTSGTLVYAFAGRDSGEFAVNFARVGAGLGDYADSASVGGRVVYRHVGDGLGAFRIGKSLPLPESHLLWTLGAEAGRGPLRFSAEGAVSRLDRNTLSAVDDGDDLGGAARVSLAASGRVRGPVAGDASLALLARTVGKRFEPFARLESPFAQESWGLQGTTDFERQDRAEALATFRHARAGEWRLGAGALRTPSGYDATRRTFDWSRTGRFGGRVLGEWADGTEAGRAFGEGGRRRARADFRWTLGAFEPRVAAESDERRFPGDTAEAGARAREASFDLGFANARGWRASSGWLVRRDAARAAGAFRDRLESRALRASLESPAESRVGGALSYQSREAETLADGSRTRSDLGSARLRVEDRTRGLSANAGVEITSEGVVRRQRVLTFVGGGRGAYDALGNFVGVGDYDLGVTAGETIDRLSRAATSARFAWSFGSGEAWKGSRLEFAYETDARRRGDLRASDPLVSPAVVREDLGLARGSLTQRFEGELAPGARALATRFRLERRLASDRAFENFSQVSDDRTGSLRTRARLGPAASAELEGRLRRQTAEQRFASTAAYARTIEDRGGSGLLSWTPGPKLRGAFTLDLGWSRPEGQPAFTRTLKVGPDLGVTLLERGRLDVTARRAFVSGPPAVGLLPSADPAGAPVWEGTARFDYRVRESTTVGLSLTSREFAGRRAQTTGRAEVRAFF